MIITEAGQGPLFPSLSKNLKYNKKAVLSQGNRAMPQLFFLV